MKRLRSSEKSDEPVNSEQGQGMQLTTSSECSEDEKISSDMSTLELGMMLVESSSEAENAAGDAEDLCSATIWGGGRRRRKKARSSRQVRRKTPPMLAFGRCDPTDRSLQELVMPHIEKYKSLNINLKQVASPEDFATPRHSAVVKRGEEPTVRVYGTLRCFPTTFIAADILTERNKLELSSCLRFDPVFAQQCQTSSPEWENGKVVSADFAEWIMGLPRGWTSCDALPDAAEVWKSSTCLQASLAQTQQRTDRLISVSIFSGIGALDLGLLHWAKPVVYCEKDPAARQVLQARIAEGSLPGGTIIDDVVKFSAETLQKLPDSEKPKMLTAGFPCQDISKAGKQQGLKGSNSSLFYEIIRIIDACPCLEVVFLENVDAIRSLKQVWSEVLDAFLQREFYTRWVSLPATAVGCPQMRKRWFFLARRGDSVHIPFADSLQTLDVLGVSTCNPRLCCPAKHSGVNFNFGRPKPSRWLVPMTNLKKTDLKKRLEMLGNAVVPQQASLAAQILSTDF